MPKTVIREIDYTGGENFEYQDFTVLIPGMRLVKTDTNTNYTIDGLYTKLSDFDNKVKEAEKLEVDGIEDFKKDESYVMAYELLKRGLSVQFVGIYEADGDLVYEDGSTVQDADADKFLEEFYDKFKDLGLYDLRFITTGGIKNKESETETEVNDIFLKASQEALKCAGERGDAVACLYVPEKGYLPAEESGLDPKYDDLDTVEAVNLWVAYSFDTLADTNIAREWLTRTSPTEKYGSYGALFTPFETNVKLSQYESGTAATTLSGAFVYLACFANQLVSFAEWYATAGSRRGSIPFNGATATIKYGDAATELFENGDEGHIAVNVIRNIRPYGELIWGARTMLPFGHPYNRSDLPAQLVATSFLNIRQLCCSLKKTIRRSCERYKYDPNTDVLWINFKSGITPLLEKMKADQGIRGYKIIQVPTTRKATCVARVVITPIEPVEDFFVTVELSDEISISE